MSKKNRVNRRGFLAGAAAAAGATLAVRPPVAMGQQVALKPETTGGNVEVTSNQRPGSDFMVDVIKSLGIEYCRRQSRLQLPRPARIDHQLRRQQSPELLTCCHEESSVAMAHGYAKIEGKPMLIMAHGTVGLQHASMAIYNAYCDRVPVYIMLGNILGRRTTAAATPSGCTACRTPPPWCATTSSGTTRRSRCTHFAESAVRAYKIAMTPPYEPVVIVADGALAGRAHHRKESSHPEARR